MDNFKEKKYEKTLISFNDDSIVPFCKKTEQFSDENNDELLKEKKSYQDFDTEFEKVSIENSKRLERLLSLVNIDIRKLLKYEISSVLRENEELKEKCLVTKKKIQVMSEEMYLIREESLNDISKIEKLKNENSFLKQELKNYESNNKILLEKYSQEKNRKNEKSAKDLLSKSCQTETILEDSFFVVNGTIDSGEIEPKVMAAPNGKAYFQMNRNRTSESESDDNRSQISNNLVDFKIKKKFTREELKDCRYFKKDGTPNMTYKENRDKFIPKGLKKDGTPDMRFKKNIKALNEFCRNLYQNDSD
ncbi:unnamed protein product [Brachionus calyciflorus]|uniref:Uncharacterized protein n=1 Tax=Brachionus calyciflorus TaxID=104777 RepID=A0A813TBD8_9BILA|nr:unnamed protein product [Brachionus calyciflorus]